MKLCERCHCFPGQALSQSYFDELNFGSFNQSHWPCSTLWPISMLSMIFETPRITAPTANSGHQRMPAKMVARPRKARNFCQATTRRKRSEEHTSELQSRENLVCRLLLAKK